ncbi:MAG: sugar transferase [Fimbriimonas sp.]|nr:sugar transferase [Fimbriimonas sp.]
MKRAVDIVGATIALILFGIPMIVIALLIRVLDPGPVFFRQARLGKNGTPFLIFKFRSMKVHAPDIRNEDGSAFTGDDDPRVTKLGRFLRKTSLDELPQFINVLFGHMSLVGPRPDQVDQIQYYTEIEKQKLLVKPGITGLAQISGRNSISWDQRKELDVKYAQNNSVLGDLAIVARTIPYVLLRKDVNSETTKP